MKLFRKHASYLGISPDGGGSKKLLALSLNVTADVEMMDTIKAAIRKAPFVTMSEAEQIEHIQLDQSPTDPREYLIWSKQVHSSHPKVHSINNVFRTISDEPKDLINVLALLGIDFVKQLIPGAQPKTWQRTIKVTRLHPSWSKLELRVMVNTGNWPLSKHYALIKKLEDANFVGTISAELIEKFNSRLANLPRD